MISEPHYFPGEDVLDSLLSKIPEKHFLLFLLLSRTGRLPILNPREQLHQETDTGSLLVGLEGTFDEVMSFRRCARVVRAEQVNTA